MTGWKTKTVVATIGLLIFATNGLAENKVDKDVAYGTHERHVLDVYWNTDYKDAPIVFTIHGGAFKNGNKSYCNEDMQKLYMAKGCIVVSPNYRLKKEGTPITIEDCTIDVAMAVAYIQANAKKYGGDPEQIVSTGSSAGGYLSAQIAYRKQWKWPTDAKHTPRKLNVIAWFGDSPYLPPHVIEQVAAKDVPGFIMYGGEKEHPHTPAKLGHDMQAMLKSKKIWNKMVYIDAMGHVPAKKVLYSPRSRDKATYEAYNQFLDMVCYGKGEPKGGDVIEVGKKNDKKNPDRFNNLDKNSNGKAGSTPSTSQVKQSKLPGGAGEAFEVKEFKGSNGESIAYSLYTPEKIDGKLPLVLCLHGRGGNTQAANVAASQKIQSRNPSFVMAPGVESKTAKWVARRGTRSAMPELMEAIDDLIKNHPIDPHRIYVTGQSMGGVGTWGMIATHPDKFAAAAPVCGIWREEDAAKMKDIPLWAFHGDQDRTVPVSGSRNMITALKAAGGNPKYTEYSGVGHDSWTKAYATDEFWVWLFKQSK